MDELKKIICIDDDPDILTIVDMALAGLAGLNINQYSSGVFFLDAVDDLSPTLLLMDMMMPKMTGLDVYGELKRRRLEQKFPVIFMTAKAQHHEVKEYIQAGAIGVISKPFDPLNLHINIQDILETSPKNCLTCKCIFEPNMICNGPVKF